MNTDYLTSRIANYLSGLQFIVLQTLVKLRSFQL